MEKNKAEKSVVSKMIGIYCRAQHHTQHELCSDCLLMEAYAFDRLQRCPFGDEKPTCGKCAIHCYKPIMRHQIKQVMHFAAPRMLIHHPLIATKHFYREVKMSTRKKNNLKNLSATNDVNK